MSDIEYQSKRDAILNDFKPYTSRERLEASLKCYTPGKAHAHFMQVQNNKLDEVIKLLSKLNKDYKNNVRDPLFSAKLPDSVLCKKVLLKQPQSPSSSNSGSSSPTACSTDNTVITPGNDLLNNYVNNPDKIEQLKQSLERKKELKRLQMIKDKAEEERKKAMEDFLIKQQQIAAEIEAKRKKQQQQEEELARMQNIPELDFDLLNGDITTGTNDMKEGVEHKITLLPTVQEGEQQPGAISNNNNNNNTIDQFLKLCFQDDIASINEVKLIFTSQAVTYDILTELTDDILKHELNILKWVQRRKIMKQVSLLQ